jgi:hypothetical protein
MNAAARVAANAAGRIAVSAASVEKPEHCLLHIQPSGGPIVQALPA